MSAQIGAALRSWFLLRPEAPSRIERQEVSMCRFMAPWVVTLALLPAGSLSAAVFTVGPGGMHADLQSALDAAVGTPGNHAIRIRSGTLVGNGVLELDHAKDIVISGGWNAFFAARSKATATVLEGVGDSTLLYVIGSQGRVELRHLTFTHPNSTLPSGLCVRLVAGGSMVTVLRDSEVRDCVARVVQDCTGIGVNAYAHGSGRVELLRNRIVDNRCEVDPAASGVAGSNVGLTVTTADDATALVIGNLIEGNLLQIHGTQGNAAGVNAYAIGSSELTLHGNRISDNIVRDNATGAYSSGYAVYLSAASSALLVASSNIVSGNLFDGQQAVGAQVFAVASGDGRLLFTDSEISDGSGGSHGLYAGTLSPTAQIRLLNLTVAGNSGHGLRVPSWSGTISLFNTILARNGSAPQLDRPLTEAGSNLITDDGSAPDPRFVSPANGDYRLHPSSPARDAGDSSPPGGLGSSDATSGRRVVGVGVDIGAHEFGAHTVFANGFEQP
jgi:hypothetical protein